MQKLGVEELENLAVGAAVLGSGGGGDPAYDLMIAKRMMETNGEVEFVGLSDLKNEALVVPLAYMGAPLVMTEKLPTGKELIALVKRIEQDAGKRATHLMAAEAGGGNAFTPITAALMLGLPLLDADFLGRAFPELQMSSCHLKGISPAPSYIADSFGRVQKLDEKNPMGVEKAFRQKAVGMGSSAAVSLYIMNGAQAKHAVVEGSLSRAIGIGKRLRRAEDPIFALGGEVLGCGIITDIDQKIEEGFLNGTFTIHGERDLIVAYRNEFLAVFDSGDPIASTPDILIPIEMESGMPVTSESLVYGIRVALVKLDAPSIWKTEAGLKLVGPQYFGYGFNYGDLCHV